MGLVVHKYGGTSLASPAHIRRAAQRTAVTRSGGHDVVVVVSAMGHTTDHLIRLSRRTVEKPSKRELDMLLTTGERVSMSLLAMALDALGVAAISFTGSQSGIITDETHNEARIIEIRPHRIRNELANGRVVIIAGFQGVSRQKEITTLGRGGSDTTAVALAATLQASECVIFTDVDGLFTADPRMVPMSRLIEQLDYDCAVEMASLGAKMHPRSVDLARKREVCLRIRSSFHEQGTGTLITGEPSMERTEIQGVTTQTGYQYWETAASLAELSEISGLLGIVLRHVQCAARKTIFLVKAQQTETLRTALGAYETSTMNDVGVVSVVGTGVCSNPGLMAEFMGALGGHEILFVTSNAISISVAVKEASIPDAARKLHARLIEQRRFAAKP